MEIIVAHGYCKNRSERACEREKRDVSRREPQAKRLVVFHLTDVQANGNVYQDETKKVLFKWGKAPSLVRAGRAHVLLRLAAPEAYEVWALRTDGSRIGRIPSRARDGGLAFDADVKGADGACVAYEVVRR